MRRLEAAFAAIAVVAGAAAAGLAYERRHQPLAQPVPKTAVVLSAVPTPPPAGPDSPTPGPAALPPSVFISHVPYTPQAPTGNWDSRHQEYCEAAALLMAGRYYAGARYPGDRIPPGEADPAMGQIVAVERQAYPGVLDLSPDEVAAIGGRIYGLRPTLQDAALDSVKRALANGTPVVIPVMTHGGPGGTKIAPYYGAADVYHVILITGYDGAKVITNDAGFMQGQNYAYDWAVLDSAMNAMRAKKGWAKQMLTFMPAA